MLSHFFADCALLLSESVFWLTRRVFVESVFFAESGAFLPSQFYAKTFFC